MPEPSRFQLADVVLLLFIFAMAAGTRVGYLSAYADRAANAGPFQVQDDEPDPALVANLKEHHWFGSLAPLAAGEERAAHVAPGYPWLLGELERLPLQEGVVAPLVRWVQCALGTLTVVFWFLFARRAFPGRTVAVLTGFLCALHPFWIINTAALNDGTLAAFLLAGCVWLGARGGLVGGPLTSLLFGLGLAALALVRAAFLPFAVVALLWFLWRSRGVAGGWLASLLAFLGFAIGLAPWMIRNYEAFQDVYPVVDSAYWHLWMGNNPRATGGPMTERELLETLAEVRGGDVDATVSWLGSLSKAERQRVLAEAVIDTVRQQPVETVQRRLWAGLYFFFGEDWFAHRRLWRPTPGDDGRGAELRDYSPYRILMPVSLLVLLLLGVLGWRWSWGWRRPAMPSSLALMWVPLPYLLGHAEALSGPRLPLDGVLLCYAAMAVVYVLPKLGDRLREESTGEREEQV